MEIGSSDRKSCTEWDLLRILTLLPGVSISVSLVIREVATTSNDLS